MVVVAPWVPVAAGRVGGGGGGVGVGRAVRVGGGKGCGIVFAVGGIVKLGWSGRIGFATAGEGSTGDS